MTETESEVVTTYVAETVVTTVTGTVETIETAVPVSNVVTTTVFSNG